ncbi:MAG: hypothetical protein AAF483_25615, partial [Planctomycetota bacterium]
MIIKRLKQAANGAAGELNALEAETIANSFEPFRESSSLRSELLKAAFGSAQPEDAEFFGLLEDVLADAQIDQTEIGGVILWAALEKRKLSQRMPLLEGILEPGLLWVSLSYLPTCLPQLKFPTDRLLKFF